MNIRLIKLTFCIAVISLLGACSTSGIVPPDMTLEISNVTVTQSGEVSEGSRFSHELKEEIRYEFSKASQGNKEAKIFVDVQALSFKDPTKVKSKQGSNTMVSFGRLVDALTGDAIGEFPLKVVSTDIGIDSASSSGRAYVRSDLIKRTARATLDKIYGKTRAGKIEENLAQHERQPYLVTVSKPIQLVNASLPIPEPLVIEAAEDEVLDENKNPVIIEAPKLPVQ